MPIFRRMFAGRRQERSRKSLPSLGGRSTASEVSVTPERALQIAAVYSCVRLLSESAAMLPVALYERTTTGRRRLDGHPVARLLTEAPNPDMDASEFWRTVVAWMGIRGNAYAFVERNAAGAPIALWPVSPSAVDVRRAESGRLVYDIQSDQLIDYVPLPNGRGTVRAENMLHYRAFGTGPEGLSPVGMAREQVGTSYAAMRYIGGFFARDASPGGVVSVDGELTDTQYDRLTAQWRSLHEGFDKAHRLALLEGGAKWETTTLSPVDAAFLETYKLTRADIAGIYGVPPHMIGDVDRSTSWGSGIEQQSLGYVIYSLMSYLTRLEKATAAKLFPNGNEYLKFNPNALVRGDITARYQAYAQGRNWGWLSANDIRRLEDQEPLGTEGDVYLQPLNMVPAGEPAPRPSWDGGGLRTRSTRARPPEEEYAPWVRRHADAIGAILLDQVDEIADLINAQAERSARRDLSEADIEAELTSDDSNQRMARELERLSESTTSDIGRQKAEELGGYYDVARTLALIRENSAASALNINRSTASVIANILNAGVAEGTSARDIIRNVVASMTSRADDLAAARVAWANAFATNEAASQTGARTKTWVATSADPRPSHAAADGQTVPIGDDFDVGGRRGRWPHDHRLGVDEIAGCSCVLQINM